ncbi:MAG: hypothetical protein BGP16_09945 [Sphingobium sp. 66-54]|nr:MAG: hypothetical protein BGP16_09945 [Sphingobium sp. 66-54]
MSVTEGFYRTEFQEVGYGGSQPFRLTCRSLCQFTIDSDGSQSASSQAAIVFRVKGVSVAKQHDI